MLGAFVIAAANSPKITIEQRSKLIRIAQKLMIATLAFIFFTVFWFFTTLGYDIDPNTLGTEWAKSFCFWFAAVLFLVATGTFVIGIIELVMSLKNLRQA